MEPCRRSSSAAARRRCSPRVDRRAARRASSRIWPRATPRIEITLEANPGTVDAAKLRGFAAAGVNRISFGVQSFQPEHLRRLGTHPQRRRGDRRHLRGARRRLRRRQPGPHVRRPRTDGRRVGGRPGDGGEPATRPHLRLQPDLRGRHGVRGAGAAAACWCRCPKRPRWRCSRARETLLAARGYAQYEISNYALPGRECAHNLNYWRAGSYLGVGAGAHSFSRDRRAGGGAGATRRTRALYIERVAAAGTRG